MKRSAARRLWLYGLLLLLPALAVGGLALGLLAREQSRLAEREQAARDSGRAAVETRARLIAENIELLVGDVQSALMATLLEAPAAEPRAFLTEWQATNPLVSEVFRVTADGRPVWGAANESLRTWLAQGPPWGPAPSAPPALASEVGNAAVSFAAKDEAPAKSALKEADARRDISSNVQQYQRARQEIQEVAKLRNATDVASQSALSGRERGVGFSGAVASAPAAPMPMASSVADVEIAAAPGSIAQLDSKSQGIESEDKSTASGVRLKQTNPTPVFQSDITRSGWSPWRDEGGLHLFGWRELPDRTVVGLELRLDAIKARLGEVFPAAPGVGEGYALRDATGRAWHAVGGLNLPVASEVPLAATALPGWTVLGYALDAAYDSAPSHGVFVIGAALIALLVLAILAAGALLVRQARLSEAEAALKTSFVANVSHELKTPLTTIRLYAELLEQGRVRDPAKQADYLATIGRETQRLARLVGNVLDFSRLEQGKKKYERTPFDLAAGLRRLADIHGPRLAAAGLTLTLELPGTLSVSTDRDAVEQIVLNLFDNVCKYAAEGGEVTLRLEQGAPAGPGSACVSQAVAGVPPENPTAGRDAQPGTRDGCAPRTASRDGGKQKLNIHGDIRMIIADRGPGVAAAQRERIFEKFHRVDERLTAEKGGAGLGLSIARQLARGLGGDLCCVPRVGGGAEFVLTLPKD